MKKKTIALAVALVMLFGVMVGGTLAWLTAETTPVKNTFTTSDINITLVESDNLDLKMIPGHTITKDPRATVLDGSEDCWLFVKVEKSENFDTYMTYEIADGWTAGNGANIPTDVIYRKVVSDGIGTEYGVLKDNLINVKDTVTKEMMNSLEQSAYPTLTFTAYACQLYRTNGTVFTAAEAWENVAANNTPTP